jgi:transcriptional regulator with XRE-family HTH domain
MTERLQIDGRALRALRLQRGISRAELAAEAGISGELVRLIENGSRSRQTRPVAFTLARCLGCNASEFVVNMPAEAGRHRAAVERALAEAPAVSAETARAVRDLLISDAVRAHESRPAS